MLYSAIVLSNTLYLHNSYLEWMYLSVEHYANTIYVVEICVAKLLGKQDVTEWMHPRKTITVRDIPS